MGYNMRIQRVEIEVEIRCQKCRKLLEIDTKTSPTGPVVHVIPCENCLDDARANGYENGYNDATGGEE